MTNEEIWQAVLGEVELSISKVQFTTWFKDTFILSNKNGRVVISVPNGFAKEWLENKFKAHILQALRNFQKNIKEISCVICNPQDKRQCQTKNIDAIKAPKQNQIIDLHSNGIVSNAQINYSVGLNPRYTFDNFIIGENNELARAACYAVSQSLGTNYNPLFIYGGVGLGKTHLLQSIGNEISKDGHQKKVIYISSERFTSELIDCIKNRKVDQFKDKYQQADLLIIDDIQFISGKEKTQDIFFHIFNFLYQLNKQIVISSDRPPGDIQILEERLRSRFEGGMIADIGNPDLETRIAILRSKSAEKDFFIEEDLIKFIAENIKNNVRELEGALNKVIANCQFGRKPLSMESIKDTLSDTISSSKRKCVNHKNIIKIVADFYEITSEEIIKKGRRKKIALPRQIAMFLVRNELEASYPEIGEYFGGRDHTTALYAFIKISKELEKNNKIKKDISLLQDKLYRAN